MRLQDRGVRGVRLHRRRPRRHARRPRPRRGAGDLRGRARALRVLRRHRLSSPTSQALAALRLVNLAGVISRQGALRAALHRGRGPGRARRRADALQARHPLHGRRRGARRQGHALRRHPRRRRSGRAGRLLRRARAPTSSSSSTSPRRRTSATTVVELARRAADEVFVPFTIGGGVRSVADAQAVLDAGADKVVRQLGRRRAARADRRDGAACSARSASCSPSTRARRGDGGWEVVVAGGRTPTGRDAVDWVREGVERGAGEILLTSMDRDGTKDGYDLELVARRRRRGRRAR